MDFRDSPAEAAFRAEARAFLTAHPPAKMPDYFDRTEGDAAATLALWRAWQHTLHAHGWAAITWPREFGGRGLGRAARGLERPVRRAPRQRQLVEHDDGSMPQVQ